MRHDPELALGMMKNGHGVPGGGADGPASTQEIDGVVGVDAPAQMNGQMDIHEAGSGQAGRALRCSASSVVGRGRPKSRV